MKENAYTILSTFSTATMKGIRFYFIQLFIGIAIELLVSLLGIKLYWGKFGIWAIFLEICILTYTMIYSWFYSFVSLKYHGLKTAIIPYALYIGCIYLGIAAANSWNFETVTIDDLTTWWLDPIYGFFVLILKVMTKKKLHSYPRFLNIIRKVLNVFIIIYILIASVKLEVQHSRPGLRPWSVAERAEAGAGSEAAGHLAIQKNKKGRPPSPED